MNEIVLDIETQNTFAEVGKHDLRLLKISLVGLYDYRDNNYRVFHEAELKLMWPLLEKADRLIGFNIDQFDLPIINNYYHGDLSKIPTLDMLEVVRLSYGRRIKLDDLAKATLNYGKSGDGLEAIKMFREGRLQELADYCLMDVKITKELYEYGCRYHHVKCLSHFNTPENIKVNFESPAEKAPINLSLPF